MPLRTASKTARTRRRIALSELRREEILVAATRVFGRKGYEATRAEDIAAAAGIAKGTLYLYFTSKEAIYTAAVEASMRELREELERQAAQVEGFRNKLLTAIEVRLQFWVEHQSLYRLLLTVGREPKHRKQTSDLLWAAQHEYKAILEEGIAAGEFAAEDVDGLAWATLDLVRGASQRRIDRLSCTTPRQDAVRVTTLVLAQNTAG